MGEQPAETVGRDDVVVEATVIRVEAEPERRRFRIGYRFAAPDGSDHEGSSGWLTADEASGWQPEDRGAVRFDRNRPSDSQWIGDAAVSQVRSSAAMVRSTGGS